MPFQVVEEIKSQNKFKITNFLSTVHLFLFYILAISNLNSLNETIQIVIGSYG
jgi:hypothetical protein